MAFDPDKWGDAVEKRLGKGFGGFLIAAAMVMFLLSVIVGGLAAFFKFVGDVVWPFLTKLFGPGITLDNIEAIIIVLVMAIAFFVVVFAFFVYVMARATRKRRVPQSVIDQLAKFRSQGISILNMTPDDAGTLTEDERVQYIEDVWHPAWTGWRDQVVNYLGQHFTEAEKLSFSRLGLIQPVEFGIALNGQHAHYLMQLSKQLTTLENLIDRYQERR